MRRSLVCNDLGAAMRFKNMQMKTRKGLGEMKRQTTRANRSFLRLLLVVNEAQMQLSAWLDFISNLAYFLD